MKNNILNKHLIVIILYLFSSPLIAQTSDDMMRSMGKMYVVVATIVSVFIGIIFYMVYIDKKLTKLENQLNETDE